MGFQWEKVRRYQQQSNEVERWELGPDKVINGKEDRQIPSKHDVSQHCNIPYNLTVKIEANS